MQKQCVRFCVFECVLGNTCEVLILDVFHQEYKTRNSLKSVFGIQTLEKMINWRVEIIREI